VRCRIKRKPPCHPKEAKKPRILIIGSTGHIGRRVISEIAKVDAVEAVFSSRTVEEVEAWHNDGKEAVFLDLDRPETFPEALTGVDRLFLATGYTVAMVHQSKTIVDAAADAGVTVLIVCGRSSSCSPAVSIQ
jgi:uncharacterized protein YbjT (DUF2867 family)